MKDRECVQFLQWALPRMRMRWPGFRKVRGQVGKRVGRRIRELGLRTVSEYREFLEGQPQEWPVLDGLCRITISRFFRDRRVFETLGQVVLPELAAGVSGESGASAGARQVVRCWSAGCASGEEPYSLSLLWHFELRPRWPDLTLEILATEADPQMLERARAARYPASSVRNLPANWKAEAFQKRGKGCLLKPEYRGGVNFLEHDIREGFPETILADRPDGQPADLFHLILCRNLVFTYLDEPWQREILSRLGNVLAPGGALVLGAHEKLPPGSESWQPIEKRGIIWEKKT